MRSEAEKKAYFKALRARWTQAKELLTAGKIKAIDAIIATHGLKISNTGFMYVSLQMEQQGLDGLPYLDAKTFNGWIETGFRVRKGEKSTLDGVTWINCTDTKDKEKSYMMPKGYHLFHRSQVDDGENRPTTKPQKVEPVAVMTRKDKRIDRFNKMADSLDKHIENKRRPMTQNPTPKRTCQYRSRLHEADNLERAQKAMRAMSTAIDTGNLPSELESITTKGIIETLVRKGLKPGGYYDVFPSDEYSNTSPGGKALQQLIEQGETPEEEATRQEREKTQAIDVAVDQIRFTKIPGFFPTPQPVIDKMIDLADIYAGMSVLEPSAGKGDIAEALRSYGHKADVIEIRQSLQEILKLKDFNIVGNDFLEHTENYDRIVMNPPFEKGQDVEHVRHAYSLLNPGGRLVSVMSEGPFFNSQAKYVAFREWLSETGYSEKLDSGSFQGKDSFRQTGTSTRVVVIDKPFDN